MKILSHLHSCKSQSPSQTHLWCTSTCPGIMGFSISSIPSWPREQLLPPSRCSEGLLGQAAQLRAQSQRLQPRSKAPQTSQKVEQGRCAQWYCSGQASIWSHTSHGLLVLFTHLPSIWHVHVGSFGDFLNVLSISPARLTFTPQKLVSHNKDGLNSSVFLSMRKGARGAGGRTYAKPASKILSLANL